jgi:tRNA-splicing ligase RtcB
MSRTKAARELDIGEVMGEMHEKGIELKDAGRDAILEEAPENYKDTDAVVAACATAGVSKPVAKLLPLAVIKG